MVVLRVLLVPEYKYCSYSQYSEVLTLQYSSTPSIEAMSTLILGVLGLRQLLDTHRVKYREIGRFRAASNLASQTGCCTGDIGQVLTS